MKTTEIRVGPALNSSALALLRDGDVVEQVGKNDGEKITRKKYGKYERVSRGK